MSRFEEFLEHRSEEIDSVRQEWLWIKEDIEGYKYPLEDWPHIKSIAKNYVKNFGVVVQAGGLQGMYPRLFSEFFERVYTFEPDPLSFTCLVHNCQKDNIVKLQSAVGDELGMVDIKREFISNAGMNTVTPGNQIPMLTIDSIQLDACDLIQLDVEGYESKVICGAMKTIEKFKPIVIAEARFFHNKEELDRLMQSISYDPVFIYHCDLVYAPR